MGIILSAGFGSSLAVVRSKATEDIFFIATAQEPAMAQAKSDNGAGPEDGFGDYQFALPPDIGAGPDDEFGEYQFALPPDIGAGPEDGADLGEYVLLPDVAEDDPLHGADEVEGHQLDIDAWFDNGDELGELFDGMDVFHPFFLEGEDDIGLHQPLLFGEMFDGVEDILNLPVPPVLVADLPVPLVLVADLPVGVVRDPVVEDPVSAARQKREAYIYHLLNNPVFTEKALKIMRGATELWSSAAVVVPPSPYPPLPNCDVPSVLPQLPSTDRVVPPPPNGPPPPPATSVEIWPASGSGPLPPATSAGVLPAAGSGPLPPPDDVVVQVGGNVPLTPPDLGTVPLTPPTTGKVPPALDVDAVSAALSPPASGAGVLPGTGSGPLPPATSAGVLPAAGSGPVSTDDEVLKKEQFWVGK